MHRQVEHQADIAVEVEAESLEELFREAISALIELAAGEPPLDDKAPEGPPLQLEAAGADHEERLVGILSELLFQAQTGYWLPGTLRRLWFDGDLVCAEVAGIAGKGGAGLKREIKAVTWHNLKVLHEDGRWSARIVFDV